MPKLNPKLQMSQNHCVSHSEKHRLLTMKLKGIVHLKIKTLSSFSHPQLKTLMTDLLLRNTKEEICYAYNSFKVQLVVIHSVLRQSKWFIHESGRWLKNPVPAINSAFEDKIADEFCSCKALEWLLRTCKAEQESNGPILWCFFTILLSIMTRKHCSSRYICFVFLPL